jgi:hypothetical protein
MDAITSAAVSNASAATLGTVQGAAALLVLRRSLDVQSSSAAQLIAALPQPAPVSSGLLGHHVNTYA